MKTIFIEAVKAGDKFDEVFLVSKVDKKTTKGDKPYLALTLQDRTGSVECRFWDIPEDFEVTPGAFLKVRAEASTYKDQLQLVLKLAKVVEPTEVDKGDFIKASKRDRLDMLKEVIMIATEDIGDLSVRAVVMSVLDEHEKKFRDCPAAMKKHQPYLGGLLEHVLGICGLAKAVCAIYPALNRDLLLAAAILHDMGKVEELDFDTAISYSVRGQLLGHIGIGLQYFQKYALNLDIITRLQLEHIIASHHGLREYGALTVPQTREAVVFNLLDMIDARLGYADLALAKGTDAKGFTPFDFSLGAALWDPSK